MTVLNFSVMNVVSNGYLVYTPCMYIELSVNKSFYLIYLKWLSSNDLFQ